MITILIVSLNKIYFKSLIAAMCQKKKGNMWAGWCGCWCACSKLNKACGSGMVGCWWGAKKKSSLEMRIGKCSMMRGSGRGGYIHGTVCGVVCVVVGGRKKSLAYMCVEEKKEVGRVSLLFSFEFNLSALGEGCHLAKEKIKEGLGGGAMGGERGKENRKRWEEEGKGGRWWDKNKKRAFGGRKGGRTWWEGWHWVCGGESKD